MPRLLGGDEARSLLLLEDFRDFSDRTFLYRGGSLGERAAEDLGSFLWALCRGTFGLEDPELVNAGMRALNHRQVFEAPFGLSSAGAEGPGLDPASLDDLEKGLGAAAMAIRSDPVFGDAVADLGRRYLGGGPCLVHGAFHPGNWLLVPDGGVRVIDPQCCGLGRCGVRHRRRARPPVASAAVGRGHRGLPGCRFGPRRRPGSGSDRRG